MFAKTVVPNVSRGLLLSHTYTGQKVFHFYASPSFGRFFPLLNRHVLDILLFPPLKFHSFGQSSHPKKKNPTLLNPLSYQKTLLWEVSSVPPKKGPVLKRELFIRKIGGEATASTSEASFIAPLFRASFLAAATPWHCRSRRIRT